MWKNQISHFGFKSGNLVDFSHHQPWLQWSRKKKENMPNAQLFLVTLSAQTINATGFWHRGNKKACKVQLVFLLFFYRSFSFMYFRFLVCHYFLFFVNYFILNYFWNIISWATSACSNSGYLSISLFSPSSYVSILQICEHTKRSWEPGLWRWRRGI